MLTFIYFLKLENGKKTNDVWSEAETTVVQAHFERLQKATEEGIVILAGRTDEASPTGIVVFKSENASTATAFMDNDPAIVNNLMSGELKPFSLALLSKQS